MGALIRFAGAAALLFSAPVFAQTPVNPIKPWTQIGDANGNALGTSANPLFVSGGGSGGGPATIDNGADVVEGNNTDAAGAASVFGMVKGIYGYEAARATTGQRTNASAGDYATGYSPDLGTTADAAYAGTGNASSISIAKGVYVNTTNLLKANGTVVLGTGSAIVGKVGIDQTTPGTTNGVVVNSSALPTGASSSANQTTEITSLAAIQARASFFADTTAALAANGGYFGLGRDAGATPSPWATFSCVQTSNQVGTLQIQQTDDSTFGTSMVTAGPVATSATLSTVLTSHIFGRYSRCVEVNGATAQTSHSLRSQFGAN